MENTYEPLKPVYEPLKHATSTPSNVSPSSNYADDSASSAMPPPYAYPSQYPPPSGMSYPHQYPPQGQMPGYPQSYGFAPGGQPYYPQQGGAYPGPPGVNYQTPQPQNNNQQQQTVVVNNQPAGMTPVYLVNQTPVSMAGAIILSCFAYWCFGMVFGGIAFILAMVGQSSAAAGDTASAIQLRNASYGVSIAGIIITVIIIAVVAGIVGTAARNIASTRYCSYTYNSNSGTYYYYCY